jgi:hypothetical protein
VRVDDAELIQVIRDFVGGETRPSAFRSVLTAQDGFARLLDDGAELPEKSYIRQRLGPGVAPRNTYEFLLALDLRDEGITGPLNAVGALTQFMDRRGIVYEHVTDEYSALHGFVLAVQPAWLDLDAEFVRRNVLDKAPSGLGKTATKKWAREHLRAMFRCAGKPPRWIQSPAWPMRGDQPLVFMGQVTVDNYFHDRAVLYVFHDPDANEFETVAQLY